MQNGHLRERLTATGDRHVGMTERNLVGRIGDGLVGRRTGATHRIGLQRLRKMRQQRDFARNVWGHHRRNDRPEDQQVGHRGIQGRTLHQFGHRQPPEVDGRVVLEQRA